MIPTWSNKQVGASAVLKRLDRCYLVNAQESIGECEFRVDLTKTLSDHNPISFKLGGVGRKKASPSRFRVDPIWLEIPNYLDLVSSIWQLDVGIAKANIVGRWEDRIKRIRKIFQEISIHRNKRSNREKEGRLKRIKGLKEELVLDPRMKK